MVLRGGSGISKSLCSVASSYVDLSHFRDLVPGQGLCWNPGATSGHGERQKMWDSAPLPLVTLGLSRYR